MQNIEKLYRLPNGSALLLSDVRGVLVRPSHKDYPTPYVTLLHGMEKTLDVHFANDAEAIAFADTIRPLIDDARAGADGIAALGTQPPQGWAAVFETGSGNPDGTR